MTDAQQLETSRLRLRQWQEKDLEPFAKLNSDEDVMEYFPSVLDYQQSKDAAHNYKTKIEKNGWGFWVTEKIDDGAFIGLVGLNRVDDLPIGDCVEVGWRLAKEYWGYGFATEAARACLEFAFTNLDLSEIVAITTVNNLKSQAVMHRLGMGDSRENFEHPKVDAASGLREHVLYKISKSQFMLND